MRRFLLCCLERLLHLFEMRPRNQDSTVSATGLVGEESFGLDPPSDRAWGDTEVRRRLRNRQKISVHVLARSLANHVLRGLPSIRPEGSKNSGRGQRWRDQQTGPEHKKDLDRAGDRGTQETGTRAIRKQSSNKKHNRFQKARPHELLGQSLPSGCPLVEKRQSSPSEIPMMGASSGEVSRIEDAPGRPRT